MSTNPTTFSMAFQRRIKHGKDPDTVELFRVSVDLGKIADLYAQQTSGNKSGMSKHCHGAVVITMAKP